MTSVKLERKLRKLSYNAGEQFQDTLTANFAGIRLLPGMNTHVDDELVLTSETFAANGTGERLCRRFARISSL